MTSRRATPISKSPGLNLTASEDDDMHRYRLWLGPMIRNTYIVIRKPHPQIEGKPATGAYEHLREQLPCSG